MEFLFPRKIGRLSYFIRALLCCACFYPALSEGEFALNTATLIAIGVAVYQFFFVVLPRARDCALPLWCLFGLFIPIVNAGLSLVLLFKRTRIAFVAVPDELPSAPTADLP
jgi:hypothetical protein